MSISTSMSRSTNTALVEYISRRLNRNTIKSRLKLSIGQSKPINQPVRSYCIHSQTQPQPHYQHQYQSQSNRYLNPPVRSYITAINQSIPPIDSNLSVDLDLDNELIDYNLSMFNGDYIDGTYSIDSHQHCSEPTHEFYSEYDLQLQNYYQMQSQSQSGSGSGSGSGQEESISEIDRLFNQLESNSNSSNSSTDSDADYTEFASKDIGEREYEQQNDSSQSQFKSRLIALTTVGIIGINTIEQASTEAEHSDSDSDNDSNRILRPSILDKYYNHFNRNNSNNTSNSSDNEIDSDSSTSPNSVNSTATTASRPSSAGSSPGSGVPLPESAARRLFPMSGLKDLLKTTPDWSKQKRRSINNNQQQQQQQSYQPQYQQSQTQPLPIAVPIRNNNSSRSRRSSIDYDRIILDSFDSAVSIDGKLILESRDLPSDNHWRLLGVYLTSNPKVRIIRFHGMDITVNNAICLGAGALSQIRSITFCDNNLGLNESALDELIGILLLCDYLESAAFIRNSLVDKNVNRLVDLIQSHPTLTSLSLCWNGITSEGAKQLALVLRTLTSKSPLTKLDLSYNRIGNRGIEQLFNARKHHLTAATTKINPIEINCTSNQSDKSNRSPTINSTISPIISPLTGVSPVSSSAKLGFGSLLSSPAITNRLWPNTNTFRTFNINSPLLNNNSNNIINSDSIHSNSVLHTLSSLASVGIRSPITTVSMTANTNNNRFPSPNKPQRQSTAPAGPSGGFQLYTQ